MAQQQLDSAQIGAGLQQVNGEGVAQRMRRDWLADPAPLPHLLAGVTDGARRDRLVGRLTREQPLPGARAPPIVPEHVEELGRQHDIAVFAPFALLDPDDHTLAVDRGGGEADGFGNPQTGCVTDGQNHAMLQIVYGAQQTCDLNLAQHDGKLLGLPAGWDVVLDDPRPFEGDRVEKPQSGNRDNDRTGCQVPLMGQVELIRPDLSGPEMLRGFAEMASEPDDLFDIGTLRLRCQVANLHVLDHATAKRAHRQLLCEMNSATWRRRIVSRWSGQTRVRRSVVTARRSPSD